MEVESIAQFKKSNVSKLHSNLSNIIKKTNSFTSLSSTQEKESLLMEVEEEEVVPQMPHVSDQSTPDFKGNNNNNNKNNSKKLLSSLAKAVEQHQ